MLRLRYYIIISLLVLSTAAFAQEKKKLIKGYDGGMMVHTGYLAGTLSPISYKAEGMTFGIGGLVKFRLSDHFRNGVEGYVSTMEPTDNGSYVKVFWTGSTFDYFWQLGKWMPYAGVTLGGGVITHHIMLNGDKTDWLPEPVSYYHKKDFLAIDPYIGCDYCVSDTMHLTIRLDNLFAIGNDVYMPSGPRLAIGFIFSH